MEAPGSSVSCFSLGWFFNLFRPGFALPLKRSHLGTLSLSLTEAALCVLCVMWCPNEPSLFVAFYHQCRAVCVLSQGLVIFSMFVIVVFLVHSFSVNVIHSLIPVLEPPLHWSALLNLIVLQFAFLWRVLVVIFTSSRWRFKWSSKRLGSSQLLYSVVCPVNSRCCVCFFSCQSWVTDLTRNYVWPIVFQKNPGKTAWPPDSGPTLAECRSERPNVRQEPNNQFITTWKFFYLILITFWLSSINLLPVGTLLDSFSLTLLLQFVLQTGTH